jgi:hypothetical protein
MEVLIRSACFAHQEVMLAAKVGDDRLVHAVAAHADRAGIDDVAERQHRHLGGAAADVHDHVAGGSVMGIPAPMAAAMGSAMSPARRAPADSTDWRIARFSTGVAPWGTQTMILGLRARTAVDLADEVLDHLLGHVEVGDDAFAHGPDRLDGAGGAAEHQLGVLTDGETFLTPSLTW